MSAPKKPFQIEKSLSKPSFPTPLTPSPNSLQKPLAKPHTKKSSVTSTASRRQKRSQPLPLFDSMQHLSEQTLEHAPQPPYPIADLKQAQSFLTAYKGSQGTFNSYRREIERLLHWCTLIQHKSLDELKRQDIEAYLSFCKNPPPSWIGVTKPPRFLQKDGARIANLNWKPFLATVSKMKRSQGHEAEIPKFVLSEGSLRELLAILSSFFNYLLQEEHVHMNPIALLRQKSTFIRRVQQQTPIRRLSELQWQYVLQTCQQQAEKDEKYERTLFMLSALYAMYLRISELASTERWTPLMNHFYRDNDHNWWFTTVGKGNKQRQIAVSDAMLTALKRWRQHLNLSPLPSAADNSPLLPKVRGKGAMKSINHIRRMVQFSFDSTVQQLIQDGLEDESATLQEATVHWLRHTGISDDVKIRPREHVRDDAGHSSGAVTDRYIDVEHRERHMSAKRKKIAEDD
jgi:site-specific recombinase XerD